MSSISELTRQVEEAGLYDPIQVGEKVIKYTGDYTMKGTVLAVFNTSAGQRRFVVEHNAEAFGGKGYFLHIYGPNNIKRDTSP